MILFLFHSTHDVIKAESACCKNTLSVKVVPVPRSISSDCGMALEINCDDEITASKLLEQNNIEFEIHKL